MSSGRWVHRLRFFVADAWDEWRHSPGVNLLAVATLATSLFLAGLVMLVVDNIEDRTRRIRDDVRVEVYLQEGLEEAPRQALERELARLEGVQRVEYVDKAEAYRRYRSWAAETAQLIEELETNPLPSSFEVYLVPGDGARAQAASIADDVRRRPEVEEAVFNRRLVERLDALLDLVRIGGAALAAVVFVAVAFVMASVLRLAVHARRDEIEIMLLVGATPGFVRGPFLVAGLGQGLLSGVVALLLVEVARRAALGYARTRSLALVDLVAERSLALEPALILVGVGLLVSLTGSYFAVRRSV